MTNQDSTIPGNSPDLQTKLAQELQKLAPEIMADGKIDVQKLQELLDSDATDATGERFGLLWPGKKMAQRAAQLPTTATLVPAKDESKDWDTTQNVYIEGDNLEVLKVLQRHYHNKVKMIYIDPPYNTGKDFVYKDNYKDNLKNYLEFSKQVNEDGKATSTNSDADGRYHSNWLNMIYPRLKLARNLLTDDGVIFISIDDNEVHHLRKVCDEVFGEENVEIMVWNKEAEGSSGTLKQTKRFRVIHEYVIVAFRSKEQTLFNKIKEPLKGKENELQTANLAVNRENERNDHKNYFTITNPGGVKFTRQWKWDKTEIDRLIQEDLIYWGSDGNKQPRLIIPTDDRRKTYLLSILNYGGTTVGNKNFSDLMKDIEFSYPKPVILLTKFLETVTQENSLIFDFFSGSATTAQAVMQLNAEDGGNRKFIMVQIPEETDDSSESYKAGYKTITEIGKERIRRAGEKIKNELVEQISKRETPLDTGFRVYKLADTNFAKWQVNSDATIEELQSSLLDAVENITSQATEESLLTELLIKLGYSLSSDIKKIEVNGLPVWSVTDGGLLAYTTDEKPTLEQLRAVVAKTPEKLVILDRCFAGDDELKTNLAQLCNTNNIELRTA